MTFESQKVLDRERLGYSTIVRGCYLKIDSEGLQHDEKNGEKMLNQNKIFTSDLFFKEMSLQRYIIHLPVK